MELGGFNSLSKFELFIWDLEIFLQIQKRLGDKIILKGGAATQFYIPISAQRTSIDYYPTKIFINDELKWQQPQVNQSWFMAITIVK